MTSNQSNLIEASTRKTDSTKVLWTSAHECLACERFSEKFRMGMPRPNCWEELSTRPWGSWKTCHLKFDIDVRTCCRANGIMSCNSVSFVTFRSGMEKEGESFLCNLEPYLEFSPVVGKSSRASYGVDMSRLFLIFLDGRVQLWLQMDKVRLKKCHDGQGKWLGVSLRPLARNVTRAGFVTGYIPDWTEQSSLLSTLSEPRSR